MGKQREEHLSTMGTLEQILEKRVSRLGLGGYISRQGWVGKKFVVENTA